MTKKPLKNKSHRMRSQTKKLGPSSKNPIKKKPIKKKSLKKKPNKKKKTPKKTKKGVGIFNRLRKKINPEYKLRTIVFMYNENNNEGDSEIGAYYNNPSSVGIGKALKKFRFNVNQVDISRDRIVIKEAYEEEGTEFLEKFENKITFSINKYSTIPLGKGKFSLKFWGENETVHQDIIDFFQPKKEKFNEKFKQVKNGKIPAQPIAQRSAQPPLTSEIKFSVSRNEKLNNSTNSTYLSDL